MPTPAGPCLQDEMKALQYINTGAFLVGYLGFLATFILDQIYLYFRVAGVVRPNNIVKHTLRTMSPHFNLARWAYCLGPGFFCGSDSSARASLQGGLKRQAVNWCDSTALCRPVCCAADWA